MHSFITPVVALAISALPAVSAHGWVSGVSVNGKTYQGANPSWPNTGKTPSAVWYSGNGGQQNPMFSEEISSDDMACHHSATPGSEVIPVKPGDTLDIKWETPEGGPWRTSHEGPMIDYLASCGTDCRHAKANTLKFFKIAEAGMYQSPHTPGGDGVFGLWGTDTLRNNNNMWKVKIPEGVSGPHVLRTEAFALMGAGNLGHAQLYPQCINLDIQGSGSGSDPCANGADCRLGRDLYKETDPGIYISIHKGISKYQMPGPALFGGAQPATGAPPTTAAPPTTDAPPAAPAPPAMGGGRGPMDGGDRAVNGGRRPMRGGRPPMDGGDRAVNGGAVNGGRVGKMFKA